MDLPDLFNRKLSPPQHHPQHSSAPSSSQFSAQNEHDRSNNEKIKRGRKVSNEQIPNSTFYLHGPDELSDSPPISTDRRSSGRLGWVKTFFGTSPRQSTSIEEFGPCEQTTFPESIITPAECCHPHHKKEKDGHYYMHLCALTSTNNLLPEILLSPAPELLKTPSVFS